MFGQLRQVATRGLRVAVRVAASPGPQASAKRYALQVGAAVTAMGVRKAADLAEEKIEELETRGSLSPKAAAVASGLVRATSAGVSVTAAVVSNTAGSVIGGNELVRLVDAVRDAARNPATAQTDLKSIADDPQKGELATRPIPDAASVPEHTRSHQPIVVNPKHTEH
jgi:hypothetical protein